MRQPGSSLFNEAFVTTLPPKQKKGRSETLILDRNDCLVARYYFYGKFSGHRYSIILRILSKEFFLSEGTIPDIIEVNAAKIRVLKALQPDVVYFKEKWPHFNWVPTMVVLD